MDGGNYDDDDDNVGNPFPHWDPSFIRPPAASLAPRRSPLPLDQGEQKTLGRSSGLRPSAPASGFFVLPDPIGKGGGGRCGTCFQKKTILFELKSALPLVFREALREGPVPHWDPISTLGSHFHNHQFVLLQKVKSGGFY